MNEKKIKRNIILSIIVISIIEIALFYVIFAHGLYYLLWAPFLFVLFLIFAIYCDLSKLKEVRQKSDNNNN